MLRFASFWRRRGSAPGGLPMVALLEQGPLAVEELVGQLGQATLEAVLAMTAASSPRGGALGVTPNPADGSLRTLRDSNKTAQPQRHEGHEEGSSASGGLRPTDPNSNCGLISRQKRTRTFFFVPSWLC